MGLFPEEDMLAREIESWRAFAESLRAEDRELFKSMLNDCYRYSRAINAKGEPFPAESLLMALIFSQHKIIGWLVSKLEGAKKR
ncbi:MAG: hypothetical protein ACREBU_21555 [Nitrososphaera sp.]